MILNFGEMTIDEAEKVIENMDPDPVELAEENGLEAYLVFEESDLTFISLGTYLRCLIPNKNGEQVAVRIYPATLAELNEETGEYEPEANATLIRTDDDPSEGLYFETESSELVALGNFTGLSMDTLNQLKFQIGIG